jgi:hypothetical protein
MEPASKPPAKAAMPARGKKSPINRIDELLPWNLADALRLAVIAALNDVLRNLSEVQSRATGRRSAAGL